KVAISDGGPMAQVAPPARPRVGGGTAASSSGTADGDAEAGAAAGAMGAPGVAALGEHARLDAITRSEASSRIAAEGARRVSMPRVRADAAAPARSLAATVDLAPASIS